MIPSDDTNRELRQGEKTLKAGGEPVSELEQLAAATRERVTKTARIELTRVKRVMAWLGLEAASKNFKKDTDVQTYAQALTNILSVTDLASGNWNYLTVVIENGEYRGIFRNPFTGVMGCVIDYPASFGRFVPIYSTPAIDKEGVYVLDCLAFDTNGKCFPNSVTVTDSCGVLTEGAPITQADSPSCGGTVEPRDPASVRFDEQHADILRTMTEEEQSKYLRGLDMIKARLDGRRPTFNTPAGLPRFGHILTKYCHGLSMVVVVAMGDGSTEDISINDKSTNCGYWGVEKVAPNYYLEQALRNDEGYANRWQASIACSIADYLKGKRIDTDNHDELQQHANAMGDILMKHLFGVTMKPAAPVETPKS